MTDTQREAFEKIQREEGTHETSLKIGENGEYKNPFVEIQWSGFQIGWQAALAHSQQRDLPAKKPEHEWNQGSDYPSRDSYADGYANGWNDCIDAITNRKDE